MKRETLAGIILFVIFITFSLWLGKIFNRNQINLDTFQEDRYSTFGHPLWDE